MRCWAVVELLAAVMLFSPAVAVAQRNTTAGAALLEFKAGITNWAAVTKSFQGWTDGTQSTCTWTGVACNANNDVTDLALSRVGLVGPLSAALGDLKKLRTVDLSFNQLTGSLPEEWGSSQSLPAVRELLLTSNQLSGSLPPAWGGPSRFADLASLQLGTNKLSGGLPATWAASDALASLAELDLSDNQLIGSLATTWGAMGAFGAMTNLDLSSNGLTGSLPGTWGGGSFQKLTHLSVASNRVEGALPPAWAGPGHWPALLKLMVQDNALTGEFPKAWFNATAFPKLEVLIVRPGNTGLCGTLPTGAQFTVESDTNGTTNGTSTIPLTGNLGSCATACGGLTTTAESTNLYDISVEAEVALGDLLALNAGQNGGAPVPTGTTLVRPCYSNGGPEYLGGNIAYQQAASQSTTVGAAEASLAVASPVAVVGTSSKCTLTQDGTSDAPAWWMVDLGVSTKVAGLVLSALAAVPDLKILVGDSAAPLSNTECAVGVQIAANTTFAQICNGQGRYVSLTRVSGLAISLCGVEVFPEAANAAIAKNTTASRGGGAQAVDGSDSQCAALTATNTSTGAWLTVDLGYRGQLAAIGVDLGSNDVTELSLRVGDRGVTTGTENDSCQPSVSNLPGYSKTLFGCTLTGRYVTVLATNAAMTLDLCLLTVFLQDAPTNGSALSPTSELLAAPGPAVDALVGKPPLEGPAPEALAPSDLVDLGFRLVLIGPYVVDFDGKEAAVINALNTTLMPLDPIKIQITSYTVGAPVPSGAEVPAPAPDVAGRRRLSAAGRQLSAAGQPWLPGAESHDDTDALADELELVASPATRRSLKQQVSEGAVIINVVVRTTAAKKEEMTQLLANSVASGAFTTALNNAGLQAQAARFSVVPTDGVAPAPVPEGDLSPGSTGSNSNGGGIVNPPGSPAIPIPSRGSASGAAIGGGIGGGIAAFLLLAAILFWVMRRRRHASDQQGRPLGLSGGKGDVESASDTGSSTGGDTAASGPWWRFGRRRAAGSTGSHLQSDSPGASRGTAAFLVKGAPSSMDLGGGKGALTHSNGSNGSSAVHAHAHADGRGMIPLAAAMHRGSDASLRDLHGGTSIGTGGGDGGSQGGTDHDEAYQRAMSTNGTGASAQLLLPAGVFMRSSSSGILTTPSGWETPLGMGPGGAEGSNFMSPEQQVALGGLGPLGLLARGPSDVTSELELAHIAEDPPATRWTSTSAELWPITYQELTFLKQIGEGSFGRVYMARWRETTVAVKVLHRQTGDHQDDDLPLDPCPSAGSPDPILHALQKEAGIMASVRHPNVISYLGVCPEPACIVTEYCSKGSLTDVLRRGRASNAHAAALDWPRRLNMAMDAAKGMLHLHLCDPPIIHRDLKSPNLLVDKHWKLKVCDFNLSRVMEESVVLSSMVASNPRWLAPEILAGLPYTVAADVYSFGVIMWELLTWEVPWSQQNTWQVHAMVTVEKLRPDLPGNIGGTPGGTFGGISDYLSLMSDCWAQSPEDRPDFESVIGRLRRMLAVETLTRQNSGSVGGSGSPSRLANGSSFGPATASAPRLGGTSSPLVSV